MKDKFTHKASYSPIVTSKSTDVQGFFGDSQQGDRAIPPLPTKRDFFKLKRLVKHRDTTDCINLIEKFGFHGDAAISVLAFLQQEGAA